MIRCLKCEKGNGVDLSHVRRLRPCSQHPSIVKEATTARLVSGKKRQASGSSQSSEVRVAEENQKVQKNYITRECI